MKLIALLLAVLLLCGCVAPPVETDPPTQEPTEGTQPPRQSILLRDHSLSSQALQVYGLSRPAHSVSVVGDKILVVSPGQLFLYEEDLLLAAAVDTKANLTPGNHFVEVTEGGIGYFVRDSRQVVLLDSNLNHRYEAVLPEALQGEPVFSSQMDTVFYCTAEGIRALQSSNGIARLLRQQKNAWQGLSGSAFDGELLACSIRDARGNESTTYIRSADGIQTNSDQYAHALYTSGDDYFLARSIGAQPEYLFGSREGEVLTFNPGDLSTELIPVPQIHGVIGLEQKEEGMEIVLYDLTDGKCVSRLTLNAGSIRSVVADVRGYIWFLMANPDQGGDILCRWEYGKSAVQEEAVYTGVRYTAENPDREGLQTCVNDADQLGEKYGVELRIWNEAVRGPWSQMEADYRVEVFEHSLETLEEAMAALPEGFLTQVGTLFDSGKVVISLVRDAGEDAVCMTWKDGQAYVALEMGADLAYEFYYWVYQVADTYVLNSNSIVDDWNEEKPAQDRARYFANAMMSDNAAEFDSHWRQDQLTLLCRALRDAFGLKKHPEVLPWEQYLWEPLVK